MYSVASLMNGIENAKINIKTFEDAIQKERDTINEYHEMIDVIKEKKRHQEDFESRIEVDGG
jgi:hypothetical protein